MGLLLVSKQYMFIIAAPALIMLRPRDGGWIGYIKWCGKAFLAGAMVSLPLMLWNLPAYIHSNFAAAAGADFRYDAMSFFAYWADTHGWTPPTWIGAVSLVVAVPVTIASIRRCEFTAGGFAAACSVVMVFFFALNKFAFANYFYLVIATSCASVRVKRSRYVLRNAHPQQTGRATDGGITIPRLNSGKRPLTLTLSPVRLRSPQASTGRGDKKGRLGPL